MYGKKSIGRKQMTITWDVDDLNISHWESRKVSKMLERFKSIYGDIIISQGKMHRYLQMELDYSQENEI